MKIYETFHWKKYMVKNTTTMSYLTTLILDCEKCHENTDLKFINAR